MSDVKNNHNIRYRTYTFSTEIIHYIKLFPQNDLCFILSKQRIRSATSIGANVFEARAASSQKDFRNFYRIALKSCNETLYWLCLIKDSTDIDKFKTRSLINEAKEISKMIAASVIKLQKKKNI